MPTLAEHIGPLLATRFPPSPYNPSKLGFNVDRFARAMAEHTGNAVASERRTINKVFNEGQYPREPWITALCTVLEIEPGSLPDRPFPLDRGARLARDVLADSLAAFRAGRPEDAETILEKALRWFDDYHGDQPQRRSARG